MNNCIGMGAPNGSVDISDMLSFNFGTYLIVHGAHGPDQVRQIKQHNPDARIYLRRVGGIGSSPLDVLMECVHMLDDYRDFGVTDLIAWNEADRAEEGGFSSRQIAEFALSFLQLARGHLPTIRLHWPALAHLPRYQNGEEWIWLPVARQYDVMDFHAYHDPNNVRQFFQFFSTFTPDKPVACTEYNYGPGNTYPHNYGDWIYEVYRMAIQDFPQAESVCPFIWEWVNPEPGVGTSLDIRQDGNAKSGILRAQGIPIPLDPLPPVQPEPEPEVEMTDRERYEPLARRIALEVGLDPDLFVKQITQESNWNPLAVSPSGAEGLGQLMPQYYPNVDRFDPEDNLRAAASSMKSYVGSMKQNFPTDDYVALALASYNAGLTAMTKWRNRFGVSWRRALTSNRTDWNSVTGYANEQKADQVALYLNKIVGPMPVEPVEPNPEVNVLENVVWIGSPNMTSGRAGQRVIAIVDHIMAGTLAGCDSWFNNPTSKVSAHFGIGKNGELHQYVRTGDTAWANGIANRPDTTIDWIRNAIANGANLNALTVSIEHEGLSGQPFTEAMYQTSLRVHRYLIKQYGIPIDRQHIIGHNKIDSVNRSGCPGAGFPWDRLFRDLLAGEPVTPPPVVITDAQKKALWADNRTIADALYAASDTLFDVNSEGNQNVTEQQTMDESWRIATLLEAYAERVKNNVRKLKGE